MSQRANILLRITFKLPTELRILRYLFLEI